MFLLINHTHSENLSGADCTKLIQRGSHLTCTAVNGYDGQFSQPRDTLMMPFKKNCVSALSILPMTLKAIGHKKLCRDGLGLMEDLLLGAPP